MKRHIILLISLLLLVSDFASAQASRWKRTRYELVGGIGVSTFVGELGGKNNGHGHFMSDYDFTSQRVMAQAGMRYKILNPLAVKGQLSYAWLSGSDAKTDEVFRRDRNLSFRTNLWELGVQLEYSIIPEPINYRSRRRRKFTWRSLLDINTYVFAGVSGFYFNPKAKDDGEDGTGKWVALQKLGTEGQGLMEGRKKYKRFALAFPFGVGFKYPLTRELGIGLEFAPRYTTTDYIDDVSTTYIDNAWLASKNPQAARMSDRSIKTDDEHDPLPNVRFAPGEQRGESKFNDFYMFTVVSVSYKLKTGRNGLPKF
ncbi:MAG: outer membrane beta-barrel protein [Salinivirgaceae bacterium]|nr:outer membrane beta-barrel protein [Salinivirgaceae bacterium]